MAHSASAALDMRTAVADQGLACPPAHLRELPPMDRIAQESDIVCPSRIETPLHRIAEHFQPQRSDDRQLSFDLFGSPHERQPTGNVSFIHQPGTASQPSAQTWAVFISTTLVEVLNGYRSISHLRSWVASDVCRSLEERLALAEYTPSRSSHCASVVTCHITQSVYPTLYRSYEASATVFDGERLRICCLLLRRLNRRWIADEVEVN